MKHLNAKQTYRLSMFTAAIIFAISTMWTIVEVAAGSRTFWDLSYIPAFYLIFQVYLAFPRYVAQAEFKTQNLAFIP